MKYGLRAYVKLCKGPCSTTDGPPNSPLQLNAVVQLPSPMQGGRFVLQVASGRETCAYIRGCSATMAVDTRVTADWDGPAQQPPVHRAQRKEHCHHQLVLGTCLFPPAESYNGLLSDKMLAHMLRSAASCEQGALGMVLNSVRGISSSVCAQSGALTGLC